MSRCAGGSCSCRLTAGEGIVITGTGSQTDPFRIEVAASASLASSLSVIDSDTVDLSLSGQGNSDDPLLLRADATVAINDLIDVDADAPIPGYTIVFDGLRWVAGAPSPVAPGSVNTGAGIQGDGTVGDPLAIAVSDPGETSTSGLGTYIDSDGALRVIPGTGDVNWSDIDDVPTTFPTTWAQIADPPAAYPNALKINGRTLFVQSGTPGGVNGDLWLKTA